MKHAQILGLMDDGLEGAESVREANQTLIEVAVCVWLKGLALDLEILE